MVTAKMKTNALIAVLWAFCALIAVSQEAEPVAEKAKKLFSQYEKREFVLLYKDGNVFPVSGWEMETTNGKPLHRALLQKQADQIAQLGLEAFPVSLGFLDHKEMYIRYIAAESLRKITGKSPLWYNFGKPAEVFNGDLDWSGRAKATWEAWYQEQRASRKETVGARAEEAQAAVFPPKVRELQERLQNKRQKEAHTITLGLLGKPARDIGSGLRIYQWDIDGGTLTFHPFHVPTYRDAQGQVTRLLSTKNEVAPNIQSGFELYSRAEKDPNKTGLWFGNLDLHATGRYEYRDSGQFHEVKKLLPPHFFAAHPNGEYTIRYPGSVKPNDVLEEIPDGTEICRITFVSGEASKTFGIVTSNPDRRLRFESDGQAFEMDRGWHEVWPKIAGEVEPSGDKNSNERPEFK